MMGRVGGAAGCNWTCIGRSEGMSDCVNTPALLRKRSGRDGGKIESVFSTCCGTCGVNLSFNWKKNWWRRCGVRRKDRFGGGETVLGALGALEGRRVLEGRPPDEEVVFSGIHRFGVRPPDFVRSTIMGFLRACCGRTMSWKGTTSAGRRRAPSRRRRVSLRGRWPSLLCRRDWFRRIVLRNDGDVAVKILKRSIERGEAG